MVLRGEKDLLPEIKGQSFSTSSTTTDLEHLNVSSSSMSDDGTFGSIIFINTEDIIPSWLKDITCDISLWNSTDAAYRYVGITLLDDRKLTIIRYSPQQTRVISREPTCCWRVQVRISSTTNAYKHQPVAPSSRISPTEQISVKTGLSIHAKYGRNSRNHKRPIRCSLARYGGGNRGLR